MRLGRGVGGAEREERWDEASLRDSSAFYMGGELERREVEAAPLAAKSASLAGGLGLAGFF